MNVQPPFDLSRAVIAEQDKAVLSDGPKRHTADELATAAAEKARLEAAGVVFIDPHAD